MNSADAAAAAVVVQERSGSRAHKHMRAQTVIHAYPQSVTTSHFSSAQLFLIRVSVLLGLLVSVEQTDLQTAPYLKKSFHAGHFPRLQTAPTNGCVLLLINPKIGSWCLKSLKMLELHKGV